MAAEGRAEKVECLGLEGCLSLSNGTVEVVVTTEVGPRIARYGFVGGENLLAEMPDHRGPATAWKVWGGHRLWAAPEARPRTYAPDNAPVEVHAEDWSLHRNVTVGTSEESLDAALAPVLAETAAGQAP
jgi:hypothetical protein